MLFYARANMDLPLKYLKKNPLFSPLDMCGQDIAQPFYHHILDSSDLLSGHAVLQATHHVLLCHAVPGQLRSGQKQRPAQLEQA